MPIPHFPPPPTSLSCKDSGGISSKKFGEPATADYIIRDVEDNIALQVTQATSNCSSPKALVTHSPYTWHLMIGIMAQVVRNR